MKTHRLFSRLITFLLTFALVVLTGCSTEPVKPQGGEANTTASFILATEEVQSGEADSTEVESHETDEPAEAEVTEAEVTEAEVTDAEVRTEAPAETVKPAGGEADSKVTVKENGTYSSKLEVAEYIHLYGKLPSNYITKKEAEDAGWISNKGNLWKVTDHKSIGGSYFGNYEGQLPKAKNRKYYECDIDFDGGRRNAKRIVYSNDGLIFYTEDHYETFEQLY